MLIDQILSNPILSRAGALSEDIRGRLSKATKFVLRSDFAMAADEYSCDIDNVDKVLKLARLPFPENTWIEVAQEDRRLFAEAPVGDEWDGRVRRVGYLLTETDADGSWSALMFWSFQEGGLPPAMSGLRCEFKINEPDALSAISFHKFRGLDDMLREVEQRARMPVPKTLTADSVRARAILDELLARPEDWIGEPGFIITTLALLHSRNAAETEPVEPRNKTRKLTGKPPLHSYRLVCIPARYQHRHGVSSDDPQQLRAHFVRGHFKRRKTGLFFWSAYQRGNPELGFAHKGYVLGRPGVPLHG